MAILYKANETDFTHLGLGPLNDAVSILVTEERNGIFELEMQYPVSGQLFNELKNDRLIKADAGHNLKNQRFKIIRITKPLDGIVTVNAEHISYLTQDLALKPKVSYNGNARQALEHWKENIIDDNPFVMWSNISTTGRVNWTIDEVENPRRALGGVEGSMLDVYGGEYLFDNYEIRLLEKRGVNSDALIAYGRNLIELTQEEEIANTYTSVYPFSIYRDDDENERLVTLPEYYIDSQYVNNFARRKILAVDFTQDEIETVSALRNTANRYITDNNIGVPRVNLKVKYLDLTQTLDYKNQSALEEVNLCDNVMIYFEKFGINTTAKVIKVVWDDLRGHYDSIEIGETRASLSQAIGSVVDGKVDKVERISMQAMRTADGKNTIYYGLEEPTGDLKKNDIWFRVVDGEYTRTYRFDGIQWQLSVSADVKDIEETANAARNRASEAVEKAELATGNATEAITQAQTAFDKAQESLTTAQGFSSRISDTEDNISTLNQTTQSFATRIENAEGSISTLSQTAQGLQNRIANAEGDISSVTQLANTMQTDLRNAKGDINTLTQTASSLDSTIKSVRADLDGLEIGGRNIVSIDSLSSNNAVQNGYIYRLTKTTGAGNPYLRVSRSYFENSSSYVATFKMKKISGTLNSMGGHMVSFYGSTVYRDGALTSASSWSSGDTTFPDDTNTHIYEVHFKTPASFPADSAPFWYIQPNRPGYATNFVVEIWDFQIEKGNKATDWSPAPEDLATQSQITQLSDNINARVQKGDVINQINISTEDILISGKKLILDGDTTVTGTFRVDNANITSVDAGKMTTGTLNAAQVSIINLSANSIVGGILQSQNSNTTFNLNTGNLTMRNANFTLGGNAEIHFTDPYNKIRYQASEGRTSGLGVGLSDDGITPISYFGTTGTSDFTVLNNSFSGFVAITTNRISDRVSANSIIGNRLRIRNRAIGYEKGYELDMFGSTVTLIPMSTGSYDYEIGGSNAPIQRIMVNHLQVDDAFTVRARLNINRGWRMETGYSGDGHGISIYGLNSGSYNYVLGKSTNRLTNVFSQYFTGELVGSSARKFKKNEGKMDLQDSLEFIRNAEIVTFDWTRDESLKVNRDNPQTIYDRQVGFILDDLQMQNDYLVKRDEQTIKKDNIIFMHQQVIQHHDEKLSIVEDELTKLQGIIESQALKIADLESRLNKMEAA